ncbi:cbb3-type cytochrome oxidase subunit 3 [Pararhodospirillum photometricum]|uniref:Cbb3-type cytochrome oxidase component n=1 Tax=Pararhodospirillum photometricum DSM 122 TaxID=1150469 RepID=H6SJ55_PARPM|nr:cbb3-type cytochrome c oxidase subunit 3 [Pararhodospirillum photometricum]CCG08020.1 unnamed protein product [Pararhodospirillum photometricum DSM 122]
MDTIAPLSEWIRPFWGPWLMAVFVGIVAWAYWPTNRERLERMGSLPLRDDPDEE